MVCGITKLLNKGPITMKSDINPTFELKGIGTRRASDGVDAIVSLYRFYRKTCIETYVKV